MLKSCRTWGEAVRARDKVCQIYYHALHNGLWEADYDCKGPLEADHLIGRRNQYTRNKLENGLLLCSWHHRLSPKLSHHGSPKKFWQFVEQYMPDRWAFREEYRNKIMKQEVFK